MTAVPVETGVTNAAVEDVEPNVATEVFELLHVWPAVVDEREIFAPKHVAGIPAIGAGRALTVIANVLRQPVDRV